MNLYIHNLHTFNKIIIPIQKRLAYMGYTIALPKDSKNLLIFDNRLNLPKPIFLINFVDSVGSCKHNYKSVLIYTRVADIINQLRKQLIAFKGSY